MKTIKQIADELGVTKAALQKRMGREPLRTSLSPYIDIRNGTKYITKDGESLINKVYADTMDKGKDASIDRGIDNHGQSELYKILKNELEGKNQQIRDLNARLAETTAALLAAQQTVNAEQLLHGGTISKQLTGFSLDGRGAPAPEEAHGSEERNIIPTPATASLTEEEPAKLGFIAYVLKYFQ
jgi:hypothetical protein